MVGIKREDRVIGSRLDDEAQPLLALAQLVGSSLHLGDVVALDEDADDRAISAAYWLVDEVEVPPFGRLALPVFQEDLDTAPDERLRGRVDEIEEVEERLPVDLAQGLAHRHAHHVAAADQAAVGVVGHLEAVFGFPQHRHEARGLPKHLGKPVALCLEGQVGLIDALGALENPGLGGLQIKRGRPLDVPYDVPKTLQFDHVDGVLQHRRDLAICAKDRGVGDAPVTLLHATALRGGTCHVEAQQGHGIGFARADHAFEGGDGLLEGFRVGRERLPRPAADDVGQLALDARKVGSIGANDVEMPVEDEVGIGRRVEEGEEVEVRHGASIIPPITLG